MNEIRKRRSLAAGAYSATVVVLVTLILLVANVVASRVLARIDLTKDKEFSISKSTKEVLRGLDDVVTIKVYFSKGLPPNLATLRRNVDDVLRSYETYSRRKVRVEYVDPSSKPEEEQKLRFLGIPQVQLNVLEKDQLQVINVYMGIAILYADRHQAIPIVQDVSTLEYELTAGILQVLQTERKVLGYYSGNSAPQLTRDFEELNQVLSKTYTVRPVDLQEGRDEVPQDVNTLIVARPQSVPERVQYQIDQFIMRGGRVVFLLDPVRLDEQMGLQSPIPVTTGLDEMVAHYGVRIDHALVQDRAPFIENAGFSQGYMRYTVPYPLWPKMILGQNLNPDHPVTSRIESLVLPWAAPLEVLVKVEKTKGEKADSTGSGAGSPQPDARAYILGRSSPSATLQKGRFDLTPPNPFGAQQKPAGEAKTYPLAVALVGRFDSYFAGKPVPPAPGDSLVLAGGAGAALTESPETQILVLGNSSFASSNFLAMFPGNQEFILNAIDWMTLGDKLIAIRSRGAVDRPLEMTSSGAKAFFKYGNTFGVALLVAVFGVVRFSMRKQQRKVAAMHLRETVTQTQPVSPGADATKAGRE
jgi:ABC-type uncharacterized transport system involved in gliding motility auxiliary subunit